MRWRWGALVACAMILMGSLAAPASSAASDKAQLRAMIVTARADLKATSRLVPTLNKQDTRSVRAQLDKLRANASTASSALSSATDPASLASAAARIRTLSKQAKAIRAATAADGAALAAIDSTRSRSRALLDSWTAGGLSDSAYLGAQANWALAGASATADHAAALSAITRLVMPPKATAAAAMSAAQAGRTPASVPGLTPIPGGCALPTASAATYLGSATQPGLHLWTTQAQVSATRARVSEPSPAFAGAQKQIVNLATQLAGQRVDPLSAGDVTLHALRVGYAWMSTQRPEFARAMAADLADVTASHRPVDDLVDEAKIAMAAATDADWLAATTSDMSRALRVAREVLLVRSLGEMSCAIALKDDLLTTTLNKSVIIASGAATTAVAIAVDNPTAAAAVVKAALAAGKVGFASLSDGGTPEGPTYWNFQTVPLAGLLSTMDSVLGGKPLAGLPDFRASGVFAFNAPDPGGQVTHYSDTDTGELRCTLPAWIAGRWGGSQATAVALAGNLRQGVELLWWPSDQSVPTTQESSVFPRTGLAVVHSGSTTAWLKGQAPLNGHTHLDAGTVGLITDGVEWTVDTGYGAKGDYPGYSDNAPGGRRWTYPQTQPQWHSTLRAGAGLGQIVGATAAVTGTATSASVNLSGVLPGTTSATRTLAVSGNGLTLRDVITSSKATTLSWGWMTDASVSVAGSSAYLSKTGHTLKVTWTGLPAGAKVSVVDVPLSLRFLTGATTSLLSVSIPATTSLDVTTSVSW